MATCLSGRSRPNPFRGSAKNGTVIIINANYKAKPPSEAATRHPARKDGGFDEEMPLFVIKDASGGHSFSEEGV